jgi:hypothetical protein
MKQYKNKRQKNKEEIKIEKKNEWNIKRETGDGTTDGERPRKEKDPVEKWMG